MEPALSVCLVIKNEESVIEKCLSSIAPVADEIVILDTGSSDRTIDIIKKWRDLNDFRDSMELLEVGDKFHDEDGDFHFGNAKQAAIDEASCEYVMWMDGSDVILNPEKLRKVFEKATSISRDIRIQLDTVLSSVSFPRNRIYPKDAGKFVYAVHEGVIFNRPLKCIVTDVKIKHLVKPNRTNTAVNRNLRILKKEWQKEKHSRTAFYLGNSYMDLQQYDTAIKYFRARIDSFDKYEFKDETFKTYECICMCLRELVGTSKAYSKAFLEAAEDLMDFGEEMREGHFYLGLAHGNVGQMDKAIKHFARCMELPNKKPEWYSFWINPKIYDNSYVTTYLKKARNSQLSAN